MDYKIKAMENFQKGYNCSQAVIKTFASELDMDEETILKLSSSFGAGMGRIREVCGAVSAMFMIAGLKYGYADPQAVQEKTDHYERIQKLAKSFKEKHGTIICRELLNLEVEWDDFVPEERSKAYYEKRPCPEIVGSAAEIIGKMLEAEEKK
ncbi:MAG: C-GCAxxG-C-C family protein [Eubacteriaceae bacterium]